jgi:hypothetical protein
MGIVAFRNSMVRALLTQITRKFKDDKLVLVLVWETEAPGHLDFGSCWQAGYHLPREELGCLNRRGVIKVSKASALLGAAIVNDN